MNTKNILLVEDNEGDIELTKLTLEKSNIQNNLLVIRDGLEALNYLLKKNNYKDSETPDLVLLDIKLPKKNGFEILKELKSNSSLKSLKILMLTTGDSMESFEENYQVKASGYLEKPISLDQIEKHLSSLN